MPLSKEIMQGGFPGSMARTIGGEVASSVSAAGTTISDATALTKSLNVISSCASGAGVLLYNMEVNDSQEVYNDTATQCLVYPPTTSYQINQISAGSAHILPGYTSCVYRKVSTTQIVAYMSA